MIIVQIRLFHPRHHLEREKSARKFEEDISHLIYTEPVLDEPSRPQALLQRDQSVVVGVNQIETEFHFLLGWLHFFELEHFLPASHSNMVE